ncbi:beta-lactamase/transpeptidase-like protein [Xylariaceae sp. FL0016]|nr:beta-lactamase/transpeptidase-like protein [Xylariaceae sp. FL0016]
MRETPPSPISRLFAWRRESQCRIMRPFEQAIEAACAAEEIPGAVLLASDRNGSFHYARAFGKRSVRPGADQSPLDVDSVMWIASCTKVVTALAALQCVERGLLSLDGPVYDVLPELRHLPVLTRFEPQNDDDGGGGGNKPVLVPHRRPLTLRHLLTHASGLAYDETHPKLLAWHAWHRSAPGRAARVEARYGYPLVFEPGEGWCYGAGVDWAGVAVERASGGVSLQRYCEENIFGPVGARDIVFSSYMYSRPDLAARVVDMSKRDPGDARRVIRSNARAQHNERGGCFGGLGLFASPGAFMRVLRGLLRSDGDGVLLSREGVEEFFRPCLSERSKAALNKVVAEEEARRGMGNLPASVSKDWGLGGIVNEGDVPGGRRAGSMTWTGLPNLAWFVDRKAGVCGLYAGQLYPPADPKATELCGEFEKGIYEMISGVSPKL